MAVSGKLRQLAQQVEALETRGVAPWQVSFLIRLHQDDWTEAMTAFWHAFLEDTTPGGRQAVTCPPVQHPRLPTFGFVEKAAFWPPGGAAIEHAYLKRLVTGHYSETENRVWELLYRRTQTLAELETKVGDLSAYPAPNPYGSPEQYVVW